MTIQLSLKPAFPVLVNSSEIAPIDPSISPFEILVNGIETDDLEKVKSALTNGADADGIFGDENVIHIACVKGHLDIVRELLNNGANVNSRSWKWGDTALHRACILGHTQIVEELINRGANINIRNNNCWMTPLENAINFGYLQCCRLLINAGAKVNEINQNYGSTPLIEACNKGNYDIVELLLNSGANPDLGLTKKPLHNAVAFPKILQLLLENGAQVSCKLVPGNHNEPLHEAAWCGYVEAVGILLNAGANRYALNSHFETPLDRARRQLEYHQNLPCNPPDTTARIIEDLKKIIKMLDV